MSCALAILVGQSLSAQQVLEISAERTPPKFDIKWEVASVLKGDDAQAVRMKYGVVAMDGSRRYYVSGASGSSFLVYDATGKFVQAVGRKGQGPGEYMGSPIPLVELGDTLYVVDYSNRVTVLAPDFHLLRTLPIRLASPVVLSNGWLADVGRSRTDFGALNLYDGNGNLVKTLHLPMPEGNRRRPNLAASSHATVWSVLFPASPTTVLEQWDTAGKLIVQITRKPDGAAFAHYGPSKEGLLQFGDFREDADGRLWVLLAIPNGKSHRKQVMMEGQGLVWHDIPEYDRAFEVYDTKTGALLASSPVSDSLYYRIGPGFIFAGQDRDDGSSDLTLWKTTLVPRRK